LVLRYCITRGRSKDAVYRTIVITKPCQLQLGSLDGGAIARVTVIIGVVVIVRVGVRVIIVRVVVVRIVGQIIPWKIPGIEAAPKPIDKDKEAITIKVGAPPVPIVMPVCVMLRYNVIAKVRVALIRQPCDCRTRS